MNLALLLPAGLAALAALLLPLLIHLARRSEQRPTQFAALRWLRQKAKPRHRIRFDEWLLLLVRLLLLVVLALLLARPVLFGSASQAPWVVAVPGVDVQQARTAPAPADARRHWLAPGFPALDMPAPAAGASVTSLLREIDASLPVGVALTVLVPAQLEGADAQLPALSRRVDWRVLPGVMPAGAARAAPATIAMSVRYAPQREPALRYLRAASAAWQVGAAPTSASTLDLGTHTQPLPAASTPLVWLVPGAMAPATADWIRAGGTALLDADTKLADAPAMAALWRDSRGAPLVEGTTYGKGRVLRFTRALTPNAIPELLDADFPMHLRALFAAPARSPTRVLAADHAPATGGPVFTQAPRDLQPWLVCLIALLFVVERVLASGARRSIAP